MEKKSLTVLRQISLLFVIALSVYQVTTSLFGLLPGVYQRSVHWCLLACLGCTACLSGDVKKHKIFDAAIDTVLMAATLAATVYLCLFYEDISLRVGNLHTADLVFAALFVVSVLVISFRLKNRALVVLTLCCLGYALYQSLFTSHAVPLSRILSFLYLGTDGIFGIALGVSTNYIYLFVLLGAFIEYSGAGKFFVALAQRLTSRLSSGAAQTSLVAGGLMGLISGSGVANAVTVGSLAIPLMEENGYSRSEAAAIQAITTNIAQILPPVMGGVMFLAVDSMGKSYSLVSRAAVFPSLAYCAIFAVVLALHAGKNNLRSNQKSNAPPSFSFLQGIIYLLPIAVLVGLLVDGSSAVKAGIYAVLLTAVIGVILRRKEFHFRELLQVFERTANMVLSIAPTCACAGIIIAVMSLTNMGPQLTDLMLVISGNHLYIGLIMTMLLSLLLGMFLPSSAVYLVLAVLGVPALVNMGANSVAAHMFIIYFSIFSPITPPVALSAAAVTAMTNENFHKICLLSIRLAVPLLVVPFVFLRYDSMLFQGELLPALLPTTLAILSGSAMALCMQGWFCKSLGTAGRTLTALLSIGMLFPQFSIQIGCAIVFSLLLLESVLTTRKRKES